MISDDELLAEIHRLADGDTPPSSKKMEEEGQFSAWPYRRAFGCWTDAVREAGYQPRVEMNISINDLLLDLVEHRDGRVAPSREQFNGKYNQKTYYRKFGSWWQACVRAGLLPYRRRPLSDAQFKQFFETAVSESNPEYQVVALMFQFTGLPPSILSELTEGWLRDRAGDTLVTVPERLTESGERWTFQIPSGWSDDGEFRETTISGLLRWYLDHHKQFPQPDALRDITYRVAQKAGLDEREKVFREQIGKTPLVRPSDLRATGGVRMARNSAPTKRIYRHLGVEHTNWQAEVKDFFLWCCVHEEFVHPDYDPPDIVL